MIEFECPCGKRLKAREEHAGQTVRCPACDARVTVPAPVPEDEGPDLSGPEALASAMREATAEELAEVEEDIPEAEVLEEPAEDDALAGLDALARAVGPAAQAAGRAGPGPGSRPGKAARPGSGRASRRQATPTPAGLQPVNGQNGRKDTHKRNVIIGVAAGAGVLLIILIVIAIVGGKNTPPPPPPPPPQVYQPQPKRPTGPLPGELFPKVRPKDEEGETQ